MAELPETLGRYRIVRRLGRGGMAETFVAELRGPAGFVQRCCLKRVLPDLVREPDLVRQFMDEASLHGRLQHGNIVRVQDFGQAGDAYFIAMELVDGCDLATFLEYCQDCDGLPAAFAILVASDLCQALSYAHGLEDAAGPLGLVHRDLSPSNVLLSRAGEVKLADFGVARARGRRHRTESGVAKGKVAYMSPEQIEASRELDGRSDLFSLGALLYEMLAGVRPFAADGAPCQVVAARVLRGTFRPLHEQRPGLDPKLVQVVERLLAAWPEQRYPDAGAVLRALSPIATPITLRSEFATWVRAACRAKQSEPNDVSRARASHAPAYRTAGRPRPRTPAGIVADRAGRGTYGPVPVDGPTWPAQSGQPYPERTRTLRPGAAQAPSHRINGYTWLCISCLFALLGGHVWPPSNPAPQQPLARRAAESDSPRSAWTAAAVDALQSSESGLSTPGEAIARPTATAQAAQVRVVVIPYGNVWIDGRKRGPAPLRIQLSVGEHQIGVGRGNRVSRSRRVSLPPGPHTLVYDLMRGLDAQKGATQLRERLTE